MSSLTVPLHRSDPAKPQPPPKIHSLTSARFFAALYVVLFHTRWGAAPGSAVYQILSAGYCSVCFFFLLSGYILGAVYLSHGRPVAIRKFYVARFARIYPLYIASILADTPFAVIARVATYGLFGALKRVLVLLTIGTVMMQIWTPADKVINIPSWSLATEAIFYLSFPLLGPLLWKLRKGGLAASGLALYLVSVGTYAIMRHFQSDPLPGLLTPSYVAVFAIGILVARWQTLDREAGKASNANRGIAWALLILSGVAFAGVLWASPWLTRNGFHLGILLVPVFTALVWLLSASQILPVRLLHAKWLVVLGEASFGLYLIQVPVVHLFARMHLTGSVKDYPLYLGTCVGLSVLSFYFFETPARQWILRLLNTRTKETMEAASDAQ
jgi:peptidoglycan/LPS O-acetylase OafA/YrhL